MKEELRAILTRLLEVRSQKQFLEQEESVLWAAFFSIADREAGPGKTYRYLDEDLGYVMARSIAQYSSLDEDKLKGMVGYRRWLEITVAKRVVDPTFLEAAVKKGNIPAEIVEQCITRKEVARRIGPKRVGKEELEELELARKGETIRLHYSHD